jgi:hypothetical protein
MIMLWGFVPVDIVFDTDLVNDPVRASRPYHQTVLSAEFVTYNSLSSPDVVMHVGELPQATDLLADNIPEIASRSHVVIVALL